jgi:hypothetical protein
MVIKRKKGHRRTPEEFVQEMKGIRPTLKIISDFTSVNDRVDVECLECGHCWSPLAGQILQGYGCKQCQGIAQSKRQMLTQNQFVARAEIASPTIEVLGVYKGSTKRVECKCRDCGKEWSPLGSSVLQGVRCGDCSRKSKIKSHDQFVREVSISNPDVTIIGRYTGVSNKVKTRCNKCGRVWDAIPSVLLRGGGCKVCGHLSTSEKQRMSQAEFVEELAEVAPYIKVLGNYKNIKTPIKCKCMRCSKIWWPRPDDLLHNGSGCPECAHQATSFMEQAILLSFRTVLGIDEVISRDRALIGIEVDVYIPSLNLVIEPGAWKWHENRLERDEEKRNLCANLGIRMIMVYDSYPYDKAPFSQDCYIYKEDLGGKKNHVILRQLVDTLFDEVGIYRYISQNEWEKITEGAFEKSRKIKTSEFIKVMNQINPDVEVVGEYTNSGTGIDCICKICHHFWSPTPNHLKGGEGCPKCRKNSMSHEKYKENVEKAKLNVELQSEYVGAKKPIRLRCKSCNHKWTLSRAHRIYELKYCPGCRNLIQSNNTVAGI